MLRLRKVLPIYMLHLPYSVKLDDGNPEYFGDSMLRIFREDLQRSPEIASACLIVREAWGHTQQVCVAQTEEDRFRRYATLTNASLTEGSTVVEEELQHFGLDLRIEVNKLRQDSSIRLRENSRQNISSGSNKYGARTLTVFAISREESEWLLYYMLLNGNEYPDTPINRLLVEMYQLQGKVKLVQKKQKRQ